ncbi:MAG: sensor histidine kinase [Candidatus Limnocylindrales bacterium]
MFERPVNGIAALIALAAILLSVGRALPGGFELYSLTTTGLGVAMLVVGGWWLARQAPQTPFREMAVPAAVATMVPFLVGSGLSQDGFTADIAPWILAASAAATLGLILADSLPHPYRLRVTLLTAALAVSSVPLGILAPNPSFDPREPLRVVAMLLVAATTAVPGLVAAVLRESLPSSDRGRESVVAALELAVLGITPAIAVIATWGSSDPRAVVPLILWILVVLAAQFFAVRPLARTAVAATTQRDQVVAAMEAERSRIAADIHDDALQDLTMLGWRLDASGDRESAATAREVAERLRAILGDLRLPILDDLGTGPALEWLVERVSRLAGGEVRLERADQVRPPAEVELAFFRVAQEALSNAVRHGRPPIVVRYWTSPSSASLSIDDAGIGINTTEAAGTAVGHFGLLNMRQRAEQIGALLDVRRWPQGGTRVTLEWRT